MPGHYFLSLTLKLHKNTQTNIKLILIVYLGEKNTVIRWRWKSAWQRHIPHEVLPSVQLTSVFLILVDPVCYGQDRFACICETICHNIFNDYSANTQKLNIQQRGRWICVVSMSPGCIVCTLLSSSSS